MKEKTFHPAHPPTWAHMPAAPVTPNAIPGVVFDPANWQNETRTSPYDTQYGTSHIF